jgi:hypothetical protein
VGTKSGDDHYRIQTKEIKKKEKQRVTQTYNKPLDLIHETCNMLKKRKESPPTLREPAPEYLSLLGLLFATARTVTDCLENFSRIGSHPQNPQLTKELSRNAPPNCACLVVPAEGSSDDGNTVVAIAAQITNLTYNDGTHMPNEHMKWVM